MKRLKQGMQFTVVLNDDDAHDELAVGTVHTIKSTNGGRTNAIYSLSSGWHAAYEGDLLCISTSKKILAILE